MEERPVERELVPNFGTSDDVKKEVNQNEAAPIGIFVDNLTAKWSPDHAENTLTNVSLKVNSGELLAVIGHVGSGKV